VTPVSVAEATIVLRDGSTVTVRPLAAADEAALARFYRELSEESRYMRFFSASIDVDHAAHRFAEVEPGSRYGIVALAGPDGAIVAHAAFFRTSPGRAEVALAVADRYQNRGLGTILLGQVAEAADRSGLGMLEGVVHPANRRMLDLLREIGSPVSISWHRGEAAIEFPSALTPEAVERFEQRDRAASQAAVRSILAPRSVAVIGASGRTGSLGAALFRNLLGAGFCGALHPVNLAHTTVQTVPAVRSVRDIQGQVDLAVVAVPPAEVLGAARECAAKGVRGLVVISAGFAERGAEGRELQRELVQTCRRSGMRLVGPNCMGVVNTSPAVQLYATFAPVRPTGGRVGFLSQSGGLALSVIEHAAMRGLGLSSFVSVGNEADVSSNDLLQYWEEDADTDLAMLYLEAFSNPRKFARVARRVSRVKPIVAVKSGRTPAGGRATSSHTGALLTASDVTVDALFRQSGVIRTDALGEMVDAAVVLAREPLPAGRRVGILTNVGGLGVQCADACEGAGLEVPGLPEALARELTGLLPPDAVCGNPVDMTALADARHYERALRMLAGSGSVDAIVVIFERPLWTGMAEIQRAIAAGAAGRTVPVLVVAPPLPPGRRHGASFDFPEDAARALGHAVRYAAWRTSPAGAVPALTGLDVDGARLEVLRGMAAGTGWMARESVDRFLRCYGVSLVETRVARTAREAARAAADLGGPIALKAVVPGLRHVAGSGGVRLDLRGGRSASRAAREMAESLARAGHQAEGFLVRPQVPAGVELLVGVVHDASFGPVIACGTADATPRSPRDAAVRITPLTDVDAREIVSVLAARALIDPGGSSAAHAALEDLLLRVSALVEAHPEVAELDLEPVIVHEAGAAVLEARVRLEIPAPTPPFGAR
jgi:acetate---CoA ligase (ADP-forming)